MSVTALVAKEDRPRDIFIDLPMTEERPGNLRLTVRLNAAKKISNFAAHLSTKGGKALAFAMAWQKWRIVIDARDGEQTLWLDGAAFGVSKSEVRTLRSRLEQYGLRIEDENGEVLALPPSE